MHKGRKEAYTNGYRIIKGKIQTNIRSELSKTERRDNYSPLSGKIIGQDFIKGEFPYPSNTVSEKFGFYISLDPWKCA